MDNITATLSNCEKCWFPDERNFHLVGAISNDSKNRFPDGRIVRTSIVEKLEGDLAYTVYSVYRIESWKEELSN